MPSRPPLRPDDAPPQAGGLEPGGASSLGDRATFLWASLFLALYTALAVSAMVRLDRTADEPQYVDTGRYILREGWGHPLARLHGPLPFYFSQIFIPDFPPGGFREMEDPTPLLVRGRLGLLPFGWLAALVVFLWARQLFGNEGGLLALALYATNPLMVGFGALISVDVALTGAGLLALYLAWRFLLRPSATRAAGAGLGLGLACATKYLGLLSGVVIVPWIALRAWRAAAAEGRGPARGAGAALGALAVLGGVALLVLHASYGFQSGLSPRDPDAYASDVFAELIDVPVAGHLLALFPRDYLLGIDYQMNVSEGERMPYLRGSFAPGHPDYHLWGFLLKTPEWTLLLLGWVLLARVPRWLSGAAPYALRAGTGLLLASAAVLLGYLSFLTDLQIGLRYALPALPLLFVLGGAVAAEPRLRRLPARALALLVLALAAWHAADLARYWPNGIAYYNRTARADERAAYYFRDSNTDWGQMLAAGLDELEATEAEPFATLTQFDGPRFGRVAIYLRHLVVRDPEVPGSARHWLQAFEPLRSVDGAWWLFDARPEEWEEAARADERVRAELASACLHAGRTADFERHLAALDEDRAAPLRALARISAEADRPDAEVETVFAAVRAWTRAGRHDRAEALLLEHPNPALRAHPALAFTLAGAVGKQGRVEEAIEILQADGHRRHPRSALLLAKLLFSQVRYAEAVAALEPALEHMRGALADEARGFLEKSRDKNVLYARFQDRL